MIDIGFHEVGEIFKWDGVLLEVVEVKKVVEDGCEGCYLKGWCNEVKCTTCIYIEREDYNYDFFAIKKSIRFKYISEEDMSVFDGNTK